MITNYLKKPSAEQTARDLHSIFDKHGPQTTPYVIEQGQKAIAAYSHPTSSPESHHRQIERLLGLDGWSPSEGSYLRRCLGLEPIPNMVDKRFPSPIQGALVQTGPSLRLLAQRKIDAALGDAAPKPHTLTYSDYFVKGPDQYKKDMMGSARILHAPGSVQCLDLEESVLRLKVQSPMWAPSMADLQSGLDEDKHRGQSIEPLPRGQAEDMLLQMIGLQEVKEAMLEFRAFTVASRARRQRGSDKGLPNMHAFFYGNPGTGKTEVAKLYGSMLRDNGMLKGGHVVVTTKADLTANYVGQTGKKVRDIIDSALDGVLFVDEAHALFENAGNGYAQEVLTTINTAMVDYRNRLAVVFATYPAEKERLFSMESGLDRRFGSQYHFPNYSDAELAEILLLQARRAGLSVQPQVAQQVAKRIGLNRKNASFGNAGAVESALSRAIRVQSRRLELEGALDGGGEQLYLLLLKDFHRT